MAALDKTNELKQKLIDLTNHLIQESDNEDKEKLNKFNENLDDTKVDTLVKSFCNELDSDNKNFKLFIERRSRIFGNKFNLKLIEDISLNTYLEDETSYAWECIQLLYAIYNAGSEDKYIQLKVEKVIETIEKFNLGEVKKDSSSEKKKPKNKCDDLVMDLADTLRNNIVNSSKESENPINPMETMFKTAQNISQKYASQIQSGNISMNDMFDSLGRMMGEIQEKTSNDDELKNVQMDNIKDPTDMMKDLGIDNSKFNPMEMVSNLLGNPKTKEKLSEEQIKEMEEFYSQFNSEEINVSKKSDVESNFKKFNEELMTMIPSEKQNELKNMTENILSSLNN